MVYAVVSDNDIIEFLTSNITNAVDKAVELKEKYYMNIEVVDSITSIEHLIFYGNRINREWAEDFYDLVPYDAGIDIKIPIVFFNQYFNNIFNEYADIVLEDITENHPNATEDEIDLRVDKCLIGTMGCTPFIYDKIMHGEYEVII